jgi:hypothetical protein
MSRKTKKTMTDFGLLPNFSRTIFLWAATCTAQRIICGRLTDTPLEIYYVPGDSRKAVERRG